jgi:hypothetical protein
LRAQRLKVAVIVFALWGSANGAASPFPQNKRSKSNADINAIGRRHIVHDPNLYSPEKEYDLGKALSQEVERSSKLLNDPEVAR